MKKNKKDIVYGDIEIPEEDLKLSNAKVRVNTWIDGDVVFELKKRAKKEGTKYQTLLNTLLRNVLFDEKMSISDILKRLENLEKKVG